MEVPDPRLVYTTTAVTTTTTTATTTQAQSQAQLWRDQERILRADAYVTMCIVN